MENAVEVKKGQGLLAEPFMWDANFKRAVILLCEHNEEGSFGFIINKRLEMRIDELIGDFPEFEGDVFYGGPVQTDTIHFLHNVGKMIDDSVRVGRGIYWGGDFEKVKFLIQSKLIKPQNIRFYVGYSGWSEGQLQGELEMGSWVISDMFSNDIFKAEPEDLWQEAMTRKGDPYSVIAQMPEFSTWN
jgi:putative transcriptional regulator